MIRLKFVESKIWYSRDKTKSNDDESTAKRRKASASALAPFMLRDDSATSFKRSMMRGLKTRNKQTRSFNDSIANTLSCAEESFMLEHLGYSPTPTLLMY